MNRREWLATFGGAVLGGAACRGGVAPPSIVVTEVPPTSVGGPNRMAPISGRVSAAAPTHRIVVFARSGVWYVQPFVKEPFTRIRADLTWTASIHLGSEYAALLVDDGYRPPARLESLPAVGDGVLAIVRVPGAGVLPSPAAIRFSGYEWQVRAMPSDRGGHNQYDTSNVRVAADGALHLSLVQRSGTWTSAEVALARTLGYGTYAFIVRDLSKLDPAAMLTLFTYDEEGPSDTFREMNIQVQRASPGPVQGQAIVQPNYLAGNIRRYVVPPGTVTHWFRWEPGRVVFGTTPGLRPGLRSLEDRRREFTVGVPTAGTERVRVNLCYFRKATAPPRRDVEVAIERFQYFP